jgi:hypothetical protein
MLAREHVLAGQTFPRGTRVSFDEKRYLVGVVRTSMASAHSQRRG